MCEAYQRAKDYSEKTLEAIRADLAEPVADSATALTFGSFARREASRQSDIDYLVLTDKPASPGTDAEDIAAKVEAVVRKLGLKSPSRDGAFGSYAERGEILRNLGGDQDTNHTITRRLLMLLEGEWLTDKAGFHAFRRKMLEHYVESTPRDHQIALFLLNDIIRYWRTITVDYVYKTAEDGKPWAIRNMKLVFSRKLMYASGVFSVAMTVDRTKTAKVDVLENLFDLPVIERMVEICGRNRLSKVLSSYNIFLREVERPEIRDHLSSLPPGARDDPEFRSLKNESHHFTRELYHVLEKTFHATHPIHRAVLF